ncbi:MAG: hypothetical protein WDZ93_04040 [Candidatus Paceibacterota bacterium]
MIRKQKRQLILIGAITVAVCALVFALPSTTHAQTQEVQLSLGIVEGIVYKFATALGGVFLWLAGTLFDITITSLVIGMGDWINNASLGGTIDALWIVIRDIFNILFIFGLIYIGFRTILGIGDSNTQRAVVFLIGAALLINFSLYFTKAIIDFSNIAAYQIYNMIQVTPDGSANSGQLRGISDAFMQYSSLSSYADPNTALLNDLSEDAGWLPSGRVIAYAFLMMVFMLVAAFIFLAGSILLIARFIALILFMIFSPIMFLGWIMPGFSSWSTKWWKEFLNYAFVAPAFLFMIYLSLRVLQQYDVAGGSFAAAFTSNSTDGGFTSIFLNFFVIMGFLWASLMVARQMGTFGADRAISIGQGLGKKMSGSVSSWAGRNTVGRGSRWLLEKYDRGEARSQGKFAKWSRRGATALSFGALSDRNVRGTLEKGQKTKFGGSYSHEDDQKYAKEQRKRLTADKAAQDREEDIQKGLAEAGNLPAGTTAVDAPTMKKLADAVKNLSDTQLTEGLEFNQLTNKTFAVHLTNKHVEALEKAGAYSDAQLAEIKKARGDGFKDIANEDDGAGSAYNDERRPEWLAQKGTDEVAKMPVEVFTSPAMANHLVPGMVEAKMKSGLSGQERDDIRDNIDAAIAADKNASPPDGTGYTKQWKNWVNRSVIGPRLGLTEIQ